MSKTRTHLHRRVYVDHRLGYITLDAGGWEYNVKLSRCTDYASILGWSEHISRKRWATASMVNAFINGALKANEMQSPGF